MERSIWSRLQAIIGMTTLIVVLLSALMLGANRPVSWSMLTIVVTLIFVFQVLVIFASPAPLALRRALAPGLLFAGAALWGWAQSSPGFLTGFAHPVWAFAPDATPAISADPGQGRHAVMRMFCYAMIFVIMVCACARSERAGAVLKMIALFSSALAGYGFYTFIAGDNPILGELSGNGVMQASFVNRNSYATYAAFGMLANMAVYLRMAAGDECGLRHRLETFFSGAWIYALGALLCLGAVFSTQSRAGGASALFGLSVFLLAWRNGARRSDPVLVGLVIGVLLFVGATSATGLLERMIATDSAEGRFVIYPAIRDGILDRPFLGHGIGAFHEAFRAYIPLEGAAGEWVRAHSTYLELVFCLGAPAAVAVLLAQAFLVRKIWRGTVVRRGNRSLPCFALGCAVTAALHSGFDFSLQMPATAALFAVILALGFAQSFTHDEISAASGRLFAGAKAGAAGEHVIACEHPDGTPRIWRFTWPSFARPLAASVSPFARWLTSWPPQRRRNRETSSPELRRGARLNGWPRGGR